MNFLLGVHRPHWLTVTPAPLFVSANRIIGRATMPRRAVDEQTGNSSPWAMDSGGFTCLQNHGTWDAGLSPRDYIALVRRCHQEIGGLAWVAPQDWMCEPAVINGGFFNGQRFVGTKLSVIEHQRRTVINFVELRNLAADLVICPAVQGWAEDEYARHVDMYWDLAGVDLSTEPLVLVGSVCRRQSTEQAGRILERLWTCGLRRLHGLGFKISGLQKYGHLLVSADSQSWSLGARRGDRENTRLPGCVHRGPRHTNCLPYALWWRDNKVLPAVDRSHQKCWQSVLFGEAA